ncbi:MAG: hypothetical protein FP815_05920 [Desulfobulbaceae bacterium]|nr:hypothetical protein [Desulfobulbaceae bacterium]
MRTTLNTIYSKINTNLAKITTDMAKVNEQISSGMQMGKISDEPVNLVSALRFRSSIVEMDQYTKNIQHGNTIITSAESSLTQMKELALRAKTLAIQATDPAYTTANREAIAEEVKNMFEQAVYLANTQINGKYIFGGFRTEGYTESEPTPFIIDKGDGYWINGSSPTPLPQALTGGAVESATTVSDLAANDLLINGVDIGAVDLNGAGNTNGLNMAGASKLKTAISTSPIIPAVTARLTTQIYGVASAGAAGGENINFAINGVSINYTATTGGPAAAAQEAISQINAVADATGVTAVLGDGTNGGPINAVTPKNTLAGDESAITLTGLGTGPPNEEAITGLTNGLSQGADSAHNTGAISLSSSSAITITSSSNDDTILTRIGLGGGNVGNYDTANDGTLLYGYPLNAGDLLINGITVPALSSDGLSNTYSDASAEAKASAINSIKDQTGVSAVVSPASVSAFGAVSGGTENRRLTGSVTSNGIAAGELAINGTIIGAIAAGAGPTNGLNPDKAFNAQTAINQQSANTGVYARLTTLYTSGVAATAPGAQAINFSVNGISISLTTGGVSPAATASEIASAINAKSSETGLTALVGDGSNGGITNSIVLRNTVAGNENSIILAGAPAMSGLTNGTHNVSGINNAGQISFESDSAFTITSPATAPPSDIVLTELGLSSATGTGTINFGATPKYLNNGDLKINGINIIPISTAILGKDTNNALLDSINAKSSDTGVKATRGQDGSLILTAIDGRNLHIETSTNGEAVTHLTGGIRDQITFGTLQLRSDRKFILETVSPSTNPKEPGLAALGLAGGETTSGEPNDAAGDGKIDVFSVHNRTGTIRYAGDRVNDMAIKIGKTNTMTIGENGKTGIMDTTIFSTLKALEDSLRGQNFTAVTGIHTASDTKVLLNSKGTGLEPKSQLPSEDLFSSGAFTVTVTDHDYYPPHPRSITIAVNPAVDTLDSLTSRINGIPNLSASWGSDGKLIITTNDTARYTLELSDDSSNFLKATGVSSQFMQSHGIEKSIADLDTLMENLTRQVSDFGARANRISIQSQIYSTMTIATKENLSEVQDTDMIKAVMDLKAKETAYQAALSAAAKTMQLSLVDYLR